MKIQAADLALLLDGANLQRVRSWCRCLWPADTQFRLENWLPLPRPESGPIALPFCVAGALAVE
jgi:hypothetical protein